MEVEAQVRSGFGAGNAPWRGNSFPVSRDCSTSEMCKVTHVTQAAGPPIISVLIHFIDTMTAWRAMPKSSSAESKVLRQMGRRATSCHSLAGIGRRSFLKIVFAFGPWRRGLSQRPPYQASKLSRLQESRRRRPTREITANQAYRPRTGRHLM